MTAQHATHTMIEPIACARRNGERMFVDGTAYLQVNVYLPLPRSGELKQT
jgi:hypothetical protein